MNYIFIKDQNIIIILPSFQKQRREMKIGGGRERGKEGITANQNLDLPRNLDLPVETRTNYFSFHNLNVTENRVNNDETTSFGSVVIRDLRKLYFLL